MYRWTRPQIAVPVHGELRHMSEHARLARRCRCRRRSCPRTAKCSAWRRAAPASSTKCRRAACIWTARCWSRKVRGCHAHRRALAYAGMIAITLVLDGKGRVAAEPAIIIEGIPEPVHAAIRVALDEPIKRHNPKRSEASDLKESVRRAARGAAEDAWGKKPVTRVEVIEI